MKSFCHENSDEIEFFDRMNKGICLVGWNKVSPRPLPRNSFTEQSSTVQDQLMNILDNIEKKPIVPPDSSVQNVPIIESAVPTAIHLDKTRPYVPARITSLQLHPKVIIYQLLTFQLFIIHNKKLLLQNQLSQIHITLAIMVHIK